MAIALPILLYVFGATGTISLFSIYDEDFKDASDEVCYFCFLFWPIFLFVALIMILSDFYKEKVIGPLRQKVERKRWEKKNNAALKNQGYK